MSSALPRRTTAALRHNERHETPPFRPLLPGVAMAALRTGRSAASQLSGMEATAKRSLPLPYAVQFGSRARVTIASCVSGPKNGPGPADAVGFPDGPSAPEA
jgi:hypothetical protein